MVLRPVLLRLSPPFLPFLEIDVSPPHALAALPSLLASRELSEFFAPNGNHPRAESKQSLGKTIPIKKPYLHHEKLNFHPKHPLFPS